MGGIKFLTCWLFGLRYPSTGVYWMKSNLGEEMVTSRRVHTKKYSASVFVPVVSHSCPLPPQESPPPPNASRLSLLWLLWGYCFFPLGPGMHETLCVPSKSGVCVSPSPTEFPRTNSRGLPSQILWGLLILPLDPQVREPEVGSDFHSWGRTSVL